MQAVTPVGTLIGARRKVANVKESLCIFNNRVMEEIAIPNSYVFPQGVSIPFRGHAVFSPTSPPTVEIYVAAREAEWIAYWADFQQAPHRILNLMSISNPGTPVLLEDITLLSVPSSGTGVRLSYQPSGDPLVFEGLDNF